MNETCPCGLCGRSTMHTSTKRCDGCWELEHRIHGDPALARRILAEMAAASISGGPDLVARGPRHIDAQRMAREAIEEAGHAYDRVSAMAFNIMYRLATKAHKAGWTGMLEELARAGVPTVDELTALLPGPHYMDLPDGGSVTLLEQLRRMSLDAKRWRQVADRYEGRKTSACERILDDLEINADPTLPFATIIDAEFKNG